MRKRFQPPLPGRLGRDADSSEEIVAEVKHLDHPSVYRLDIGEREHPAANARLVCEQEELRTSLAGPRKRLAHSRVRLGRLAERRVEQHQMLACWRRPGR